MLSRFQSNCVLKPGLSMLEKLQALDQLNLYFQEQTCAGCINKEDAPFKTSVDFCMFAESTGTEVLCT